MTNWRSPDVLWLPSFSKEGSYRTATYRRREHIFSTSAPDRFYGLGLPRQGKNGSVDILVEEGA